MALVPYQSLPTIAHEVPCDQGVLPLLRESEVVADTVYVRMIHPDNTERNRMNGKYTFFKKTYKLCNGVIVVPIELSKILKKKGWHIGRKATEIEVQEFETE
jgi:hypothetical protein